MRCIVVLYLYIAASTGFAFAFQETHWSTSEKLVLLILNIAADVFMWLNLGLEALYYHPDDYTMGGGSSAKRDIDVERESRGVLSSEGADEMHSLAQQLDHEVHVHHHDEDGGNRKMGGCKWLEKKLNPRQILSFHQYVLSHRLTLDVVVNVPIDLVLLFTTLDWPLYVGVRLLKIMHVLRFFDYFHAAFYDKIPERGVMRSAFVARLTRFAAMGIAWIHLWSCIWFFLGSNLHVDRISLFMMIIRFTFYLIR